MFMPLNNAYVCIHYVCVMYALIESFLKVRSIKQKKYVNSQKF